MLRTRPEFFASYGINYEHKTTFQHVSHSSPGLPGGVSTVGGEQGTGPIADAGAATAGSDDADEAVVRRAHGRAATSGGTKHRQRQQSSDLDQHAADCVAEAAVRRGIAQRSTVGTDPVAERQP